eukprot:1159025-Pelagomonas_calceolata.AAC.8
MAQWAAPVCAHLSTVLMQTTLRPKVGTASISLPKRVRAAVRVLPGNKRPLGGRRWAGAGPVAVPLPRAAAAAAVVAMATRTLLGAAAAADAAAYDPAYLAHRASHLWAPRCHGPLPWLRRILKHLCQIAGAFASDC